MGGEIISYLVCHMEKYHKTDIAPVENENERDETYQASNTQIDFTRTRNNYNIIKRQRSYTQFINDKIEALNLPTKVRKDAVLMCSFVVGSDREFFGGLSSGEQQQFFVDCTRFFAERYGEEN
ncbi:MAG: plasmid recombination protein, partial [Oscillospiraceae bacterium]